jgi:hypothetical protein
MLGKQVAEEMVDFPAGRRTRHLVYDFCAQCLQEIHIGYLQVVNKLKLPCNDRQTSSAYT